MNREGRLSPLRVLPFLIVSSVISIMVLWFLDRQDPSLDLSLFLNMSIGAFTAFLGSSIALWIYSYLTHESQRRQWTHDLEVRHFEEIYGPLYEETRKVIQELKWYGQPWLAKWREIRESSLAPFVEPNIAQALVLLERELNDLRDVAHRSWDAAKARLEEAIKEFPLPDIPNVSSQLSSVLQGDHRFLFDPRLDRPQGHVIENIRNTMKLEASSHDDEVIYGFCRHIKEHLSKDLIIKERVGKIDLIIPVAESVHEYILRRMADPFK